MSVIQCTALKDCCICNFGLLFFGPLLLKSDEDPSAPPPKIVMEMQNKDSIFQAQMQIGVEDIVEG